MPALPFNTDQIVITASRAPEPDSPYGAGAEGGSFGFRRANASFASVTDSTTLAAAVGFQRATGIDSFDGHGDRDGYRNLSGRLRATWNISPSIELGASGFAI